MERYLNKPETMTVPQASGPCYQIEIEGFRDDRRSGNLRLIASIKEDRRKRLVVCLPICEDFIKPPDGSFVGE